MSVTERFLLQPLVCGTVFHHTSLLPPLSPSSAVVLNHISSHFLIPLSDSSLICTVTSQRLVILGTLIAITFNIALKRQNGLKVGTDKPKLKVKMQSVADDDVRKRLLEQPRFELAVKGVFRLGRCYILRQGVPGLRASNWESTATDGWSLDRWHQKTIGACRTKRPLFIRVKYLQSRLQAQQPVIQSPIKTFVRKNC